MPYSVPQPPLAKRAENETERERERERTGEKYVYKHAHLARDHQFSMPTTAYFEILFPFTIPGPQQLQPQVRLVWNCSHRYHYATKMI